MKAILDVVANICFSPLLYLSRQVVNMTPQQLMVILVSNPIW